MKLDARFETVRTGESNVGNLMADIMQRAYNVNFNINAVLNIFLKEFIID